MGGNILSLVWVPLFLVKMGRDSSPVETKKRRTLSKISVFRKRDKRSNSKQNSKDNVGAQGIVSRENLAGRMPPADHLLSLLSGKDAAYHFKNFVNRKFCGETLSFWVAVEHYRASEQEYLFSNAKSIYETYLIRGAIKEVNLENEQRDLDLSSPTKETFDHLQHIAWQLLVTSDYQKFIGAQEYKDFLDYVPPKEIARSQTTERLDTIVSTGITMPLEALLKGDDDMPIPEPKTPDKPSISIAKPDPEPEAKISLEKTIELTKKEPEPDEESTISLDKTIDLSKKEEDYEPALEQNIDLEKTIDLSKNEETVSEESESEPEISVPEEVSENSIEVDETEGGSTISLEKQLDNDTPIQLEKSPIADEESSEDSIIENNDPQPILEETIDLSKKEPEEVSNKPEPVPLKPINLEEIVPTKELWQESDARIDSLKARMAVLMAEHNQQKQRATKLQLSS